MENESKDPNIKGKILITTGIYPPSIGGPATYSKLLFDELPKRGYEVKVLSYDSVRKYPRGISHFIFMFKTIAVGRGADLIYTQDPVSVGWPTMLACRFLRKKYVLRVPGDFAWEQGVRRFGVRDSLDDFVKDNNQYKSDVHRLKKVQKQVAEKAEKIIVPSRYLKKIVSRWGIDENKIVVIYNSFDEPESIEEVHLEGRNLISVGRLVPWKGFSTLIDIMPILLEKYSDLSLHIFGDGSLKGELDKKLKELNLEGKVFLHGGVDRQKLAGYMKSSDVFVLNTNYEGLSHTVLEAMALGVPVVTTNVCGNPEVIENEVDGFLVEFDDKNSLIEKISSLLDDTNLRDKFILAGKEKVKSFDREKMLLEIENEIQSLL